MNHEQPDGADLEAAFASTAEEPSGSSACPAAGAIWDAVCGASPARERRRVVDHLAACGPCAEAWRLAVAEGATSSRAAAPRGVRRPWLAAAAVLFAAVSLWLATRPTPEAYRQGTRSEIASLVTAVALPRESFRLQWSPVEPGAVYRLRVATEDLDALATFPNLDATEYVVPAAELEPVPRGGVVLWQVEAILSDGRRVASPTFRVRIE